MGIDHTYSFVLTDGCFDANTGLASFTLDAANPRSSSNIVSMSVGAAITDGNYDIALSYFDLLLHPVATDVVTGVDVLGDCAEHTFFDRGVCARCLDVRLTGDNESAACSASAGNACESCGTVANCDRVSRTNDIDQACIDCADGYCLHHVACVACAAGAYAPSAGATSCRGCAAGTYSIDG